MNRNTPGGPEDLAQRRYLINFISATARRIETRILHDVNPNGLSAADAEMLNHARAEAQRLLSEELENLPTEMLKEEARIMTGYEENIAFIAAKNPRERD